MDNLEKYIIENRKDFDSEMPSLKVWSSIDRQLDHRPETRLYWFRQIRSIAAVAAMLVIASLIGFRLGSQSTEVKSLSDVSPEHAEMERFFRDQIDQKMAQLASYRQDGFVETDIQELDAVYEELKQELDRVTTGNEDQVIQAMINNYQTKIEILEQVLDRVQSTGQTNIKSDKNEVSL